MNRWFDVGDDEEGSGCVWSVMDMLAVRGRLEMEDLSGSFGLPQLAETRRRLFVWGTLRPVVGLCVGSFVDHRSVERVHPCVSAKDSGRADSSSPWKLSVLFHLLDPAGKVACVPMHVAVLVR